MNARSVISTPDIAPASIEVRTERAVIRYSVLKRVKISSDVVFAGRKRVNYNCHRVNENLSYIYRSSSNFSVHVADGSVYVTIGDDGHIWAIPKRMALGRGVLFQTVTSKRQPAFSSPLAYCICGPK